MDSKSKTNVIIEVIITHIQNVLFLTLLLPRVLYHKTDDVFAQTGSYFGNYEIIATDCYFVWVK